nr:hypothetical protein [Tanacetum cinerariifolium]
MAQEKDGVPTKVLPCQLPPKELNPRSFTLPCIIGSLNFFAMTDLGASINVIPKSIFKHLKLANLKKTDMLVEMADMTKRAPIGIVKNVLVKIDKFLLASDFVVIDMLNIHNETMILGRPFLATIHAEIDVFNKEISFGINDDRKVQRGNTYWWHDYGLEENERQEIGIDIEEYNPPEVHVENFEVKRYSLNSGQSFICVTEEISDTLPLGRENESRFREMIRKELDTEGRSSQQENGVQNQFNSYSCGAEFFLEDKTFLFPLARAKQMVGSFMVTPFKVSSLNVELDYKIDLIVLGPDAGSTSASFSNGGRGVLQTEDDSSAES